MSLCSEPIVHVHRDRVQLLQTGKSVEKHHDCAATFDSLHCSAQDVWCDTFEVLKHAHAKGLSKDLMRVLVEAVSDVFIAHEELDLVDLILGKVSLRFEFLDLLDTLFLR